MEEDIKLLEKLEFIAYGKKEDIEALGTNINVEKLDTTKIIRNLINKYKAQKRDIQASHILLAKYSIKIEEQEKIIELMAKEINDGMFFDSKEEVIEYFKKKARDENE